MLQFQKIVRVLFSDKKTLPNLCLLLFFIICSDFHNSVHKINDANSHSGTKIFEFIDNLAYDCWER